MQAPETLRPELERLLAQRPAQVADAIRKVVRDVRPCVRLETTRVSKAPLEGSLFREYELLWRIDADHPAGFAWGTNWIYVVIHRDDLTHGALENAIVTGANA